MIKFIPYAALFFIAALQFSCNNQSAEYTLLKMIQPEDINPLSIAVDENNIWVSDVDRNSVFKLDLDGNLLETFDGLSRPMHIRLTEDYLYIPEYGSDLITRISMQGDRTQIELPFELDAPSGLDVQDNSIVIADFYNHRIAYLLAENDHSFGIRGTAPGELMYPTNVQFEGDKIWVADAYNHRIQAFNLQGEHQLTIGQDANINAATGMHVLHDKLAVSDFENNRVLIFNHQGELLQEIQEALDRPSAVFLYRDMLFVANYGSGSIAVFNQ